MDHHRLVDYLWWIHSRPNGTGAILNLIRGAKVRGASESIALSELVSDVELKLQLARHGLEDARHVDLLLHRMSQLAFEPFRLPSELDRREGLLTRCRARDVRQVHSDRGWVGDAELMELTLVALLPTRQAVVIQRANCDALEKDTQTWTLCTDILAGERQRLTCLDGWLERFEQRFSRRAVNSARGRLEEVFSQLDGVYWKALEGYFERAAGASMAA